MVERLICAREPYPFDMPVRERKKRQAALNLFTAKLFQDAMAFKFCDLSEALSAVYLSGLWHGAMFGPRILNRRSKNERPSPPDPDDHHRRTP